MRDTPVIVVRRTPVGRRDVARLKLEVSHGGYAGVVDLWFPEDVVRELGRALTNFPSSSPDEYKFYFEEEQETQSLTLKAFAPYQSSCGIDMRLATEGADCSLRFVLEAAALNRLGASLIRLLESEGGGFRWTPLECDFLEGQNVGAV
jgi:hypothetical protein